LALNATFAHPSVLAIYLVSALAAGCGGVVSTACSAAVPSLVKVDQITAAYASMQVVDQTGMVVGPAVPGLLIGTLGLPWVYGLAAATFVFATATLVAMSARACSATCTPLLPPVPSWVR
jgi:hypothetical protein